MMKRDSKLRTIVVVGFALFAMFLGAANIIFPPFLGAHAGHLWIYAAIGFVITGTGLPLFGILATAKAGGHADRIGNQVSPIFGKVLNIILLLFIGPLFAIPRTAATTVELSIMSFLPSDWSRQRILIIGTLIFFSICLFFILTPEKVIDRIGTILTPVLIVFLSFMLLLSIFRPIGQPGQSLNGMSTTSIFHQGFTTGYQTMDALASIIFCSTIYESIRNKGFTSSETRKLLVPIGLLCALGTGIVYVGYIWIGASGSVTLQNIDSYTVLTVEAVNLLAGVWGRIILALIIFLACCTTAIGLLLTASRYFFNLFKEKIPYKAWVFLMTAISYLISIVGVDMIIRLAAPLLEILYPIVIILIMMTLLSDFIPYRVAYLAAVLGTLPGSILNVFNLYHQTKPISDRWLVYLPLGTTGFGSFIPAIICAIIASLFWHIFVERKKSD